MEPAGAGIVLMLRPAAARAMRASRLDVHPLTPERWPDLEALFGPNGGYSNCWCTYWRIPRREFDARRGDEKKEILRDEVQRGPPGLLAYRGGAPVGWVAIQPRGAYPALERSTTLRRVDALPVWSITCFFVHKEERRTGVMRALIAAAVEHAMAGGARAVEAYPRVAPGKSERLTGAAGYMGLLPAFERAGFRVVARPTARQRIVRREIAPASRGAR